jgi:KamA family protein
MGTNTMDVCPIETKGDQPIMDLFTREIIDDLFHSGETASVLPEGLENDVRKLVKASGEGGKTGPILDLFDALIRAKRDYRAGPDAFGLDRETLIQLSEKHAAIDEHGVTVGGRIGRAKPIAGQANARVQDYMSRKDMDAPSGIDLWPRIEENIHRIKNILGMSDADWNSFSGQLRFAVHTVDDLAKIIDLPAQAITDILRVTQTYRMRLTPYYAGLIQRGRMDDPVLIQSVPTGEMVDNAGDEIPPVAADHSPARLVDQFYPRVVTIKATNMCAMYCTHCLRIAHIGKKDRIYNKVAYEEALDYIRANPLIRDVLITGGDAFMLPNDHLKRLLGELDAIDHIRLKRLGTRIPVTAPMRIDNELLDILEESNDRKPVRVVTQINTAQEMTPISRKGFKDISKRVFAVLNQAVLLKGVNDTRTKMWKLCETIQEAYVRPYYVFNCSYRNPQFVHLRVPTRVGRDLVESMYGNICGDAIPRYIATAGGKVPLHRDNVVERKGNTVVLRKPWSGETVNYPEPDPEVYESTDFAFQKYKDR